jgi:peroxiredoxin/uncharacterized membrane protein YphA (DoxX/SURF4 family)
MSTVLNLSALLLSIVFGVAGVAKILDLRGTRAALINFGVPIAFVDTFNVVLPLLEISISLGLLWPVTVWWSALVALTLLTIFIVAITASLRRGETHDCHCFGQLYSRPLGWPTLVRNLAFATLAGVVLWQRSVGHVVGSVPASLLVAETGAVVMVVGISVLLIKRKKESGAGSSGSHGLPIGSLAPVFELDAYPNGRKSLSEFLSWRRPLLLIFSNPTCGPCVLLFQQVGKWQELHRDQVTVVIVSTGTVKENFVNVARNGLEHLLLQQQREVAEQYQVEVTPTAVIIRPDGLIASELVAGSDQICELLSRVVELDSSAATRANSFPAIKAAI